MLSFLLSPTVDTHRRGAALRLKRLEGHALGTSTGPQQLKRLAIASRRSNSLIIKCIIVGISTSWKDNSQKKQHSIFKKTVRQKSQRLMSLYRVTSNSRADTQRNCVEGARRPTTPKQRGCLAQTGHVITKNTTVTMTNGNRIRAKTTRRTSLNENEDDHDICDYENQRKRTRTRP